MRSTTPLVADASREHWRRRVELATQLGKVAFSGDPILTAGHGSISRHLAFLPPESLDLDLSDPAQRQFGDYELLEKIGQGGMGVVYRARQQSLEREVAVKLLLAGPWASPDFIDRFRREARHAAQLNHPNIVAVYEADSHGELNYFSMALVRGDSLASVLAKRGPLPPRDVARLMRTVAESLDYANRLGVLHLDLKPGNVLLNESGEPMVADFGLARRLDQSGGSESDEISGTPSYMAPEQAQIHSHKLSPATDIYGLGAILYECLTGRPPFVGRNVEETLRLVIDRAPESPHALNRDVPLDLSAICLKCLEKHPADRYASARELADECGRFLERRQVHVRPLTLQQRIRRWGRREPRLALALVAIGLTLVLGVAATTTQWRRAEGNALDARRTLWRANRDLAWDRHRDETRFDALLPLLDNIRQQEALGDATGAAMERRRVGAILRQVPRLVSAIATGKKLGAVDISPDGAYLAIAAAEEVSSIDVASGRVLWTASYRDLPFAHVSESSWKSGYSRVAFTIDGKHILLSRCYFPIAPHPTGRCMYLIDATNGRFALPPEPEGVIDATFSPDGTRALLRRTDGTTTVVGTSNWKPLVPAVPTPAADGAWRWSRDGSILAVTSATARFVEIRDGRTLSVRHRLPIAADAALISWDLSPDARSLALSDAQGTVRIWDSDTGEVRLLSKGSRGRTLKFSADSRWLAVSGERSAVWEVSTGSPVAQMVGDQEAFALTPDANARRAVGMWDLGVKVWEVPARGGDVPVPASRGVLGEPHITGSPSWAYNPALGLVATAGIDGELRLWRLPSSMLLSAQAAPNPPHDLDFDGKHVLSLDGAKASVVEISSEHPVSQIFTLPNPISHAVLGARHPYLIAASGTAIHGYDWSTGTQLFAPFALSNSVRWLEQSHAGDMLVVTEAGTDAMGVTETVRGYSLPSGRAIGQIILRGPLIGIRFAGESRLLAWTEEDPIQLIDLRTFGPACPPLERDAAGIWGDAILSRDGGSVFAVSTGESALDNYLWEWDARLGTPRRRLALPRAISHLVEEPGGAHLLGYQYIGGSVLRIGKHDDEVDVAFSRRKLSTEGTLALSADGALLAVSDLYGVAVVSTSDMRPVFPGGDLPNTLPEHVVRLAFGPDGDRLLAQTYFGRQAIWDLAPESRPVGEIATEVGLSLSGAHVSPSVEVHDAARAALQAGDPGPPRYPSWFSTEGWVHPAQPSVPRRPEAAPALIDLGSHYNASLTGPLSADTYSALFRLPRGIQRIGGVEYDIRGLVQLAAPTSGVFDPLSKQPYPVRVDSVAVGVPIRALNVLFGLQPGAKDERDAAFARVILKFDRGPDSELELRFGTHLPPYGVGSASDHTVKPVWVGRALWNEILRGPGTAGENGWGRDLHHVYSARLENPHPERVVSSLALEAVDATQSAPVFIAITAETAVPAGSN